MVLGTPIRGCPEIEYFHANSALQMSDVIKLLPDSVANQIAAGEVIQRPASVIKELVENAVDAGATSIKIVLRDGGKNLIQVIDNGCGMSDTDARLAFERHATSKITAATDLFSLHTMGFRGEALASIAAVAQVELQTMRRGDSIGTCLCIAGSRFESQEPAACAPGTNLAVKNLFFNIPARRKFLKKDSVELTHIIHEFERLALVNPEKEFLLIHNDVTLHQLLGGGLKQRIVELFGRSLDKQLIPIETETSLVKISGFVSVPESARKRNPLQYFFVNGRNMRHPYFHKAVMQCFEELISADHHPNYFINFEVDPATIDVNINPTKNEIKFENEAPIWQILVAAIKESLGKFNAVPSIDFDTQDAIDIPFFNPSDTLTPDSFAVPDYNPFNPDGEPAAPADKAQSHQPVKGSGNHGYSAPSRLNDWDKLYEGFRSGAGRGSRMNEVDAPAEDLIPQQPLLDGSDSQTASAEAGIMQLKNKYLLVPARGGLMVIDRYRAHVNVLFERFFSLAGGAGESQQVLFPETINLSAAQNATLQSIVAEVSELGFDLAFLGHNSWSINALPAALGNMNPADTLLKIIENVMEETSDAREDLRRKVALSMARCGAVRAGAQMSTAEAESLLASFLSLPEPAKTPDGKPTYFLLSAEEMASRL